MVEPRFAVCTFQRVFDTEPNRDVIDLQQLIAGLTRFLVKPKTGAAVERAERQIEAAHRDFVDGRYRSGRHWSSFSRAHKKAEQQGQDPAAAVAKELEHLLADARGAPKRDLRLWSPALYPEGARRGGEHVIHLSCLVLDYDSGMPVREAASAWQEYFHIVHTTWSHTPEHPKLRLVLPLAEPVRAADWPTVYGWAQEHTGMAVDPTGKSLGTTFALPAVADADAPRVAFTSPGPLLDARLEGLIQAAAEPPPAVGPPREPNHFRVPIPGHAVVEGSSDELGDGSDPWDDPAFPWSP